MESQFFLHCNCPICYLPYNSEDRTPRFLTCSQGHTICSKCISIQTQMQDTFQCPFDKQLIIMLDNAISRFPVNRALVSIIEEGHANCEVHVDKKLDLICRPCKQQICDRCERKGPHSGHHVSVIEETLDEAKQKMNNIKKLVQKVQETIEGCQKDVVAREQALLEEIDLKFGECIALLLKKREETQLMVKSYCQQLNEPSQLDVLVMEDTGLAKVLEWGEKIKEQGELVKGLAVQPIFYELLEEDLEGLKKSVEESIAKGQEKVKGMIKDIEKISVKWSPQLWNMFNSVCELSNVEGEEFVDRENNESFKWRSDWEKMDLLSGFELAEEAHFAGFVDKVLDTYKFRLEAVQHLSQSSSPGSPKMPPFYLCSFSCFLGSDETCGKLLKWYILDSTLQNSEKKVKLGELRLNDNLFNILAEKVSALPEQFRFEGLLLEKEEKKLLSKKIKEYTNKSLLITHLNYLLDSYMKSKWIDACYAAEQIMKIDAKSDPYIEKVVKDATRVNCLRLALLTEKSIEAQRVEEALETLSYLQGLVKAILDGDELHAAQIQLIISEAIGRVPEDTQHIEKLKERLNQFNTAEYALRELSKTLQCYSPTKKMQLQAEGISDEEIYYWREKGENSAYKMKQLTNDMLSSLEPYVDFHNCLNEFKQTVGYEERQNLGYVYKERLEASHS